MLNVLVFRFVTAGVTSYLDAGAADGGIDYYQVTAMDTGGESSSTNVAGAQPTAPLQLTDDPAIAPVDAGRADYSVVHGHTLSILDATHDGVLANDTDPNGLTLAVASHTNPSHGMLTLNSDGTFTYTANADFTGQDTFTYTATDGIGATGNTATVTINVTDQMPEASSDVVGLSRALGPGGHLLDYAAPFSGTLTAQDADGDPLTYSLVSGPTSDQGTFAFNTSTGAYTFTPNTANMQMANLNVTFRVTDGALTSNLGDVIFAGYTITDNSTRNAMDSVPLPIAGGGNRSWSTVENSALEYGPPGLLFGAADGDTVTPDPDVPVVDSGLIESPQHGQVTMNPSDGSFDYQPAAGFVGRDWFTYRLLDGSKPSDYATIFVDVFPLNISLSVGGLVPGDPAAVIPTVAAPLDSAPFVALNLNGVNGLPQGSTVTLSMNSDVVPDLNVTTLPPGTAGNAQIIGHDAGTNTYTWTVGVNSPPPYVWVAGLVPTADDQVLFHLTVLVAPTITGTPTVAAPAASQPVQATQPAKVAGNGYLVAFDGTGDADTDRTDIFLFSQDYRGTKAQYVPGVANAQDDNFVERGEYLVNGSREGKVIERTALVNLVNFYSAADHKDEKLDVVGYSRGAFEATKLLKDVFENTAEFKDVVKATLKGKGLPGVTFHLRFVGLIAPVMGKFGAAALGGWPTSIPAVGAAMYQGLAGKPFAMINPAVEQIEIGKPDAPAADTKWYDGEGHRSIGKSRPVLVQMESDAVAAGVPMAAVPST